MRYTYIASDNTAANGVQIGDQSSNDRDVVVKKILFGLPATTKNLYIYDSNVAVNAATTNIAARMTTPAALASGQLPYTIDFTQPDNQQDGQTAGLRLGSRGTVITDGSQITIMWDYAD